VVFWDGRQLEELWEAYVKLQDPLRFHRYLCRLLGVKPAYRRRGLGMMLARGLLGFAVGALLGYLSLDILPLPPLLGDQLSLLIALLAPGILIGVVNA
jgi:GNAT superfamily N-acetyltransferase